MTLPSEAERGRRELERGGRRRRRSALTWLAGIVALGVAFWIGLAVGKVVAEGPESGEPRTLVRTLFPQTVREIPHTATVTATSR